MLTGERCGWPAISSDKTIFQRRFQLWFCTKLLIHRDLAKHTAMSDDASFSRLRTAWSEHGKAGQGGGGSGVDGRAADDSGIRDGADDMDEFAPRETRGRSSSSAPSTGAAVRRQLATLCVSCRVLCSLFPL